MTSTTHYVDNASLQAAVVAHQADPRPETAETIYLGVLQIAHGYWSRYARPPLSDGDSIDFCQDCACQSPKWSMKFQQERGSKVFNYLTTCVANHLRQWGRDDVCRRRLLAQYTRHLKETSRC